VTLDDLELDGRRPSFLQILKLEVYSESTDLRRTPA